MGSPPWRGPGRCDTILSPLPILHLCPCDILWLTWLFWAEPLFFCSWLNTVCDGRVPSRAGLAKPVPTSGCFFQLSQATADHGHRESEESFESKPAESLHWGIELQLAVHRKVTACDGVLWQLQIFLLGRGSFCAVRSHRGIDQEGFLPAPLFFGGAAPV